MELATSVYVGDFDGDGRPDVVGASITARDVIWWRNGGGDPIQWTQFLIDGLCIGAHRVQAVDLDKDGDDDVLCAGYLGHHVTWYRNERGDPVVWTKLTIGTGLTNACVAFAADLDRDGDDDVAVTAQGLNQISWFENERGDGTAWTKYIITDDFVRPWPLFACDVDGDKDVDIIAGSSHQGDNTVSWWENRGPTSHATQPERPLCINLGQNFPNPLSDHTTIELTGAHDEAHMARVQITILDMMGRQVAVLLPERGPSGPYLATWSGRDGFGRVVAPGIYTYHAGAGGDRQYRVMVKIR